MVSPKASAAGGLAFRNMAQQQQQQAGNPNNNTRPGATEGSSGGNNNNNNNNNNTGGSSNNTVVPGHHGRHNSSGRYMNLSRDESEMSEVDSELGSEFLYTVHIPATPEYQLMSNTPTVRPMDPAIAAKADQQFVSNAIFTGGFKNKPRGHAMEKMMDGVEGNHPQLAGARGGPTCSVDGCDGKAMRDERGNDITPCDSCGFRVCRDCYIDALNGSGKCPGCKEEYKMITDEEEPSLLAQEDSENDMRTSGGLPLPGGADNGGAKTERRLSLLKSAEPGLISTQSSADFDHARWLYQTKGSYGYGNALWPTEDTSNGGGVNPDLGIPPNFKDQIRRPLSRKFAISAKILTPYRY
jgi:hypothetical protein